MHMKVHFSDGSDPLNVRFGGTGGDLNYVHTQREPESNWLVKHNLGKFPSVTVVDSAENIVIGDVQYIDNMTVLLTFEAAFSGKAYFN